MKLLQLILVFTLFLSLNTIAQEYTFYSNVMKTGRCGSNTSGTPKEVKSTIIVNESDNKIVVIFADGAAGYNLNILKIKPDDSSTGVTSYQIENNPLGIQTVIIDRDPLRKMIILIRSDRNCILFAGFD
ncbi:MAG: hypothetical protein M3Q58_06060 [Bacteroidota bacterium]|nr:hypothetical protein [Bacteroidota bacterium]